MATTATILGRKVSSPTEADWVAAKRVVRYLMGTKNWKLTYADTNEMLLGYSDADWAGDISTRRSTSGFVFRYAVSWASRKQSSVTLSSMESEYVALSEASQELVWLLSLFNDLGEQQMSAVKAYEDNQSCIQFAVSERVTRRSKHIETRAHYVKELCDDGVMELQYCPTEDMVADVLTKPLGTTKQMKFSRLMGLLPNDGSGR